MARRFRDEANDVRKEVRSSNTQPRTTNKEHLWIQGAIIILLLCVSAFLYLLLLSSQQCQRYYEKVE